MSVQFLKSKSDKINKNTKKLYIIDLNLDELPKLSKFNNITHLFCYNNNLTSLKNLPKNLEYLDCSNNKLKNLNDINYKIKTIIANDNKFIFDENEHYNKKVYIDDIDRNFEHDYIYSDDNHII